MFPVGLAIAVYRKKKGMSAAMAAKSLGISRGFLSIVETGYRLPPVSLDFAEAAARFLSVEENVILASIACEHFLASVKNLKWLPVMITSAITQGFQRYYLFPDNDQSWKTQQIHVLAPADEFRRPLVSELVNRYLNRVAGIYIEHKEGPIQIDLGPHQVFSLGVIDNPKPYLFQSDSLFPTRESLVFLDSFGVHNHLLFSLSFHTPQTGMEIDGFPCEAIANLSPYKDPNIHFLDLPVVRSKREIRKRSRHEDENA